VREGVESKPDRSKYTDTKGILENLMADLGNASNEIHWEGGGGRNSGETIFDRNEEK
jgi:hypothetical protein